MEAYVTNIEEATLKNSLYRQVLFTAKNSQLVLMSLKPGEEIGEEVHDLDQFIRFEAGEGKVWLNGQAHTVRDGIAVVIPAGTRHNVINTSQAGDLKLYSLYSPPEHKVGTMHRTKKDADADADHHFDGRTSLDKR
ncbi:MAG TPA: cupin domain-containing protein [Nitrospiraceae bacterium]|nr:cupin domain-containing protein [Nitrospiraceae bacterium]